MQSCCLLLKIIVLLVLHGGSLVERKEVKMCQRYSWGFRFFNTDISVLWHFVVVKGTTCRYVEKCKCWMLWYIFSYARELENVAKHIWGLTHDIFYSFYLFLQIYW